MKSCVSDNRIALSAHERECALAQGERTDTCTQAREGLRIMRVGESLHAGTRVGRARVRAREGSRMREGASIYADAGAGAKGLLGYGKTDYPLLAIALCLSLLGLVFIYSASSYGAKLQFGDAFHYVKTQAVALVLGAFAMTLITFCDVSKLQKFAPALYLVGLALLGAVFLPVIGVESYGAKRWLNLGFFTIQPSEYAKFFMVAAIAAFASKRDMRKFSNVLAVLLIGGIVCVLLMLEPNMSITICVAGTMFLMLFASGAQIVHLVLIAIPAIAGAVALVLIEPYRLQRLAAFLNPWNSPLEEGYQLIQSYYALGSGGFFGVGLFQSRQKYLFLPFAESDFILSVIGEETGLFGVIAICALFVAFCYRGIRIARAAKDRFSCYLALGITTVCGIQSLLNVAVVCGAVPPTGLPLPFMSAGGSSLVAYLGATGVLLSVARCSTPYLRTDTFAFTYKNKKSHNIG